MYFQGPCNQVGHLGHVAPPPHFYKNEKGSLFSALKFPIQRTKKVFLEWTPLFASKASVKAISDVVFYYVNLYILHIFKNFRLVCEQHKIVWFWSYTKVPFLANVPPLSKCPSTFEY
jgi:hypothetical protein